VALLVHSETDCPQVSVGEYILSLLHARAFIGGSSPRSP
jgi:hypothetical protein